MKKAPIPHDEDIRISDLRKYSILDTPAESTFDEITKLAAAICDTRIALVSLIDTDRQWFKSKFGLDAAETPRDVSYCGHAILDDEIFIVENSEDDERFCDNPFFLNEPHVRFYAGVPLVTPTGSRIGTLCVIDSQSRTLNQNQKTVLKSLAKHVVDLLELRIKNEELSQINTQLKSVQKMTKSGGWEALNANQILWSEEIRDVLQSPEDFFTFMKPLDQTHLRNLIDGCLSSGKNFDHVCELINAKNELKWIRLLGQHAYNKYNKQPKVIGTFQDITTQRASENEELKRKSELESYARGLNRHAIIGRTDLTGKIMYANDLFCKVSGYSRSELLGSDHRILNSGYHPKSFFKEMWTKISSGGTWRGEIKNKGKDGRLYWVDTTITPSVNAHGEIEGFISFRYEITDKKLVEEKLIESEIKHSILFNQSVLSLVTLAPPHWNFTSANPAAVKLFGASSAEEIMGLGPSSTSPLIQPDGEHSSIKAQKMIQTAMEKGSHTFEWTHLKIDKSEVVCLVVLSRITHGESTYLQATIKDISAEKKAQFDIIESERNLQLSNRFLDLALEGGKIGIWDIDLRNKVTRYDRRWAQMLGYGLDEIDMTPSTRESKIHPDDLIKNNEMWKAYFDGLIDKFELIYRMKHKEGHWVSILSIGKFSEWSESGFPIRFSGTHLDITEHKQLENQLVEAQAISKIGSWRMNLMTFEQSWSQEHYKIFEIDKPLDSEFLHQAYRSRIHPDDLDQLDQVIENALKDGKDFIYNHRVYLDGGSRIKYVQGIGKITKDEKGVPVFASGTCRDCTQEVETEKALQTERAKALHNSKLASIGHLAAGVGHEINNPLAIISGRIALVEDILASHEADLTEVKNHFSKMQNAIGRISSIVKGLRTFARSDDNQLIQFDPYQLTLETVEMLKDIYKTEKVSLELEGSDQRSTLLGNRGRIQQVLVNLLANAKDATEGKTDRKIKVSVAQEKNNIKIIVTDNGCGIPEDLREKIFDPFFTTKDVNKGTGIGLSLVNTIIKEHNGKIELESKSNVGTSFSITLPTEKSAVKVEVIQKSEGQVNLKAHEMCKILVVDDEEDLRQILKVMLARKGASVTVAGSAEEGLSLVEKEAFDLVISDIKMPGIDGFGFLELLRKKDIKQPHFMFMSGGVDMDQEQVNLVDTQTSGLISKPFDFVYIFDRIAELLPVVGNKFKRTA